ncbi:MAG: hypothetical protein GXP42_18035 [Chloroflexi bacterium]|nr:hypothetical protein [Chloroflexota bacterium]
MNTDIYLEIGKRRTFACAAAWPGWCRSGRDEARALQALLAYGPRYAQVAQRGGVLFDAPSDIAQFQVVERLQGTGVTDFGAPGVIPWPPRYFIRRVIWHVLDHAWEIEDRVS